MLLAPFLATTFAIVLLTRASHKVGLLDMPGGRKEHGSATPVVGGIAIYLGILAGVTLLLPDIWTAYASFMGVALLILVVGVLDDLHDISARLRLLVQLVALSLMVFWGHIKLTHLGDLFGHGNIGLNIFGIPLTLFGAATLVNALNMMDGLDGLAGSITLTMLASLCGIAYFSGFMQEAHVLMIIVMTLASFLCFNFPLWPGKKASLFMGDAGSTLLGFILAWFTIDLSQRTGSIASPVIMLWVVAVPLLDLAIVFLKRLKAGRSPFKPGNEHLYYSLIAKGLSRTQSTLVILAMTIVSQLIAWAMIRYHVQDAMVLSAFLVTFLIYLAVNVVQSRRDHH